MPGSAVISLANLQTGLQDIYELDIAHSVNDFLITSRDLANQVDTSACYRDVQEKLLVRADDEGLSLALFLDPAVVETLESDKSLATISAGDMQKFCLALEGVSHFLYLIWNASFERSVTLLEMELQAEVDKFVMLVTCANDSCGTPRAAVLFERLFRSIAFNSNLSAVELRRYVDANQYAEKYCRWLVRTFPAGHDRGALLRELRRFYRLNRSHKLRHIETTH